MNCPKCGAPNNIDTNFCVNCGTQLTNVEGNTQQYSSYQQNPQFAQNQQYTQNPQYMQIPPKKNKGCLIGALIAAFLSIPIIIAMIAVLGPQYVKYVSKTRDAALASAAEDMQAMIKTEIAGGTLYTDYDGCYIYISVEDGALHTEIEGNLIAKDVDSGSTEYIDDGYELGDICGYTEGSDMGDTDKCYVISITPSSSNDSFGYSVTMNEQ